MTIGLLTRHPRRGGGEGRAVRGDLSDWGASGAAEVTATCRVTSPVSGGILNIEDIVDSYSKIKVKQKTRDTENK